MNLVARRKEFCNFYIPTNTRIKRVLGDVLESIKRVEQTNPKAKNERK